MTAYLSSPSGKALVLGGGGVAGIAWMTGFLYGLEEKGVGVRDADLFIGTSAGAAVAAQLCSTVSIHELFLRQTEESFQTPELPADVAALDRTMKMFASLAAMADPVERGKLLGDFALNARTVSEAERIEVIAQRVPDDAWPVQRLHLVAVDAHSGRSILFDRDAGAALVEAVAASCAVPGIWPPVTVNGRRYIDGGVRSSDNADMALGCGRILVISPMGLTSAGPVGTSLAWQVRDLEATGAAVLVVSPDKESSALIDHNPLAIDTRRQVAFAGRKQGLETATLASFWDGQPGV